MLPFWQHVIEASLPVIKICLLGSVGALLARTGILDPHGRKTLSKLIYCLFTPALTFSKLAPVLSAAHLVAWLPLVVNMFLSVAVGLLLGGLLLVVVRPPAALRNHVICATGLGNAGNLPLVLVAALVRETGGKLFGGQVLSEDLAIAYVAMGIWAATVTHFTCGSYLLKLSPEQQQQQPQQQRPSLPGVTPEQQQLLPGCDAATSSKAARHSSVDGQERTTTAEGAACVVELGAVRTSATQQQQQGHGRKSSSSSASSGDVDGVCHVCGVDRPSISSAAGAAASAACPLCGTTTVDEQIPQRVGAAAAAAGTLLHRHHHYEQQQRQEVYGSSWWQQPTDNSRGQEHLHLLGGAAGGHVVSSSSSSSSDATWQQQHPHHKLPQQHYSSGSSSSSSSGVGWWGRFREAAWEFVSQLASPPMAGCMAAVVVGLIPAVRNELFAAEGSLMMIRDCIAMFGDCCIPCLLLMLGATLSKGPGKACPPWRVVVGVGAARLIVLPLLGTGWLVAAKLLGWYHAPDPMFILVMLIQNAVPTALNVQTLAALHGNREEEMAAMLYWQYLASCVTLPAALTFFLWLLHTPTMSI